MNNRKQKILVVLLWLGGIVVLIISLISVYSLLLGAALGPIESAWLVGPLSGCLVGAVLVFYAYYKTLFVRRWIQIIVFMVFILPVSGLGILAGVNAGYIGASGRFEEVAIIQRDILFESGWHFVNSNSHFSISDKKLHECIKNIGTKRIKATLEVTSHYGKASYFRVLKFGECEVQYPDRNPNAIVPAYIPGEENNNTHNNQLQPTSSAGG